jgi:branched-chain amino acid aminotransferase
MAELVWLNGEIHPLETATVSVRDHAFLYGDGLFEGIRFYDRKVFKLDEHLDRLYYGIRYLDFEMKVAKSELRQIVLDTCQQADEQSGYIRINVTRGTGLGLDPRNISRVPNVMVMVSKLRLFPPEAYENGLTGVFVSTRVIRHDALDPRLKTIGRYVSNIYAKLEANRQGADEGLMLNAEGYLAEGTGDNLFIVDKDGVIRTPHIAAGILGGITRKTVIELARGAGFDVREVSMTTYDLFEAEEAFLTGTAAEVVPMCRVDTRPIGCGKPGEVTNQIISMFREETKNGTPF